MKKSTAITIISIFLIFISSIIHAQGFPPIWQYPNFYDQYHQPWGFQPNTLGYFSSFNYVPQLWSYPRLFSSESSSKLFTQSEPVFSPLGNGQYYIPSSQSSFSLSLNDWYDYRKLANTSDVVPGIPSFSAITYNPSMGAYYAPGWVPISSYLRPGTWVGVTDLSGRQWSLHLFADSPMLVQAGTGKAVTQEGTSQIKIITIEDDGETFTFKPGEMFRIVLPMYDDITGVDFPDVAGWEHEGMWGTNYPWQAIYHYGYEPMEIGINKDEEGNPVQENTYRALKESQYSKQLVFQYHGSDNPNDTFTVTIQIKCPGVYKPVFNGGPQF